MKKILSLIMIMPLIGLAHPGVGIVKDSKGNIFYTDLKQVWKISNGIKKLAVPNVHSHELYIDENDNLYGENGVYDNVANKHYHYLWVYRPNGTVDSVLGMKEAYIHQDFSLARDRKGNEYYIKQFLRNPDTNHIYKKNVGGKETIFATGSFKGVTWLHPQENGSLLFVSKNNVYRVDTSGKVHLIKEKIGNKSPSFKFSGNNITVWGVWEDEAQNVYVAAFSDQTVKKIDANGKVSDYFKTKGKNWAPLHGVFDNNNRLWVLEGSDKNDVRVTLAGETATISEDKKNLRPLIYFVPGFFTVCLLLFYFRFRKYSSANSNG